MKLKDLFFGVILMAAITACASGPMPKKSPEHVRSSVRHLNKGTRYYHKGCFSKAARHFQAAHERYSAADDLAGTAKSLNSLANTYYKLNDMDSAILVYDEAEALYALLEQRVGQIRALTNKSVALAASGHLSDAAKTLDQADALASKNDLLTATRLKARALLKFHAQDPLESKRLLSKVIQIIPALDSRQSASAQYAMGVLLLSMQQPKRAIQHLLKALEADRTTSNYFGIAQDLEATGDCRIRLDQHALAVIDYKRSIKIYAMLGNVKRTQQVSFKLTDVAAKTDDDTQATLHWVNQWLSGRRKTDICR